MGLFGIPNPVALVRRVVGSLRGERPTPAATSSPEGVQAIVDKRIARSARRPAAEVFTVEAWGFPDTGVGTAGRILDDVLGPGFDGVPEHCAVRVRDRATQTVVLEHDWKPADWADARVDYESLRRALETLSTADFIAKLELD